MSRASPDLPRCPALAAHAPVLQRGPAVLQVGLDPRTAVVLSGPGTQTLVSGLDGRTELSALRHRVASEGMAPGDIDAVLRALAEAGLLAGTARSVRPATGRDLSRPAGAPRRPGAVERPSTSSGSGPRSRTSGAAARRTRTGRRAVRVVGFGPLGQQLAALLLGAGVDVYAAPLEKAGAASGPLPPMGDLPAGPVIGGARLHRVNHWSKPEDVDVGLTVLAADTVELDRAVTEALLRADLVHLVLRSAGTTVSVGPLVLPGRTACLGCTDLTRRDLDPAWPVLLPQLVDLRLPTAPHLLAWAAAVATAQVLGVLQRRRPEVTGATLELDAADHLTRWRAWPVHVACGCTWAGATEWGS